MTDRIQAIYPALGGVISLLRDGIMAYTAQRIERLASKRISPGLADLADRWLLHRL